MSYDEIPYTAGTILGTHPNDLAIVGILWGLQPPPIDRCRLLELGCASGENLIAMAVAQPAAQFVGIDASARQIEIGRAQVSALGLSNVTLSWQRIEDGLTEPGKFDYVLCHGVFSWVSAAVRQSILALCREVLAANGLVYLSYNTQPGWHLRQQLRDMLVFHVHDYQAAHERISHARALLTFLITGLRERKDLYGRMLYEEASELARQADSYLFHEYLEEENTPLFFSDVVTLAATNGLQYVDEMLARHEQPPLPDDARAALEAAAPDRITAQQYLDFVAGRAFRRSILCHRELQLQPPAPLAALRRLRCAAALRAAAAGPDLYSAAAECFENARGMRLETNHPVVKTALFMLGQQYPRSLRFDDLWLQVQRRLQEARKAVPAGSEAALAAALHQCHEAGLLELRVSEPPFVLEVSEQPLASPLARAQAAAQETVVTSLRHHLVALSLFEQRLLALLDGSASRAQLVARMAGSESDATGALAAQIDQTLDGFARRALLLA